mmetsp:Transcript_13195/g.22979  ORF Transcript_13195/g.22979 Transcript_13195/m.22979 type:complete len:309 (+) Transcript_13195:365-1291(+)
MVNSPLFEQSLRHLHKSLLRHRFEKRNFFLYRLVLRSQHLRSQADRLHNRLLHRPLHSEDLRYFLGPLLNDCLDPRELSLHVLHRGARNLCNHLHAHGLGHFHRLLRPKKRGHLNLSLQVVHDGLGYHLLNMLHDRHLYFADNLTDLNLRDLHNAFFNRDTWDLNATLDVLDLDLGNFLVNVLDLIFRHLLDNLSVLNLGHLDEALHQLHHWHLNHTLDDLHLGPLHFFRHLLHLMLRHLLHDVHLLQLYRLDDMLLYHHLRNLYHSLSEIIDSLRNLLWHPLHLWLWLLNDCLFDANLRNLDKHLLM